MHLARHTFKLEQSHWAGVPHSSVRTHALYGCSGSIYSGKLFTKAFYMKNFYSVTKMWAYLLKKAQPDLWRNGGAIAESVRNVSP